MQRRRPVEWKLKNRSLRLGNRTLIVAPIAVYPGGADGPRSADADRVLERALGLELLGADVIDLGAEPTRPGAARISEAEELKRLVPVLKKLKGKLRVPICVSTYKGAVAEEALRLGAEIINDPSGGTWDPMLLKAVLHYDAGLILNHMRGTPENWGKLPPVNDVIELVARDLDAAVHRALRAGVEKFRLVIDPGLTFGKRKEQNYEILAFLHVLNHVGVPVMVGPTRKLLVAASTDREMDFAGAAGVTAAILHGASLVRVHDIEAMKPVIAVADGILSVL